ncbi:hypothetical protein F5Y05DRAFT_387848 [Hypoxylon sp. FL0543]|nr:hypothetical protein F5Y05DRAFT_387848 [Hypoxylon sp. FL0543]
MRLPGSIIGFCWLRQDCPSFRNRYRRHERLYLKNVSCTYDISSSYSSSTSPPLPNQDHLSVLLFIFTSRLSPRGAALPTQHRMVSFKKLFTLGAALFSIANALPSPDARTDVSLAKRDAPPENESAAVDSAVSEAEEPAHIERRTKSRMTLQWSKSGTIVFLTGTRLPAAIVDSLSESLGQGGVSKALLQSFHAWLIQNAKTHKSAFTTFELLTTRGGIFGKQPSILDDIGFALTYSKFPLKKIQYMLEAIYDWASEGGNLVQVIARPDNFFDLKLVGGSKRDIEDLKARSKGNKCPANVDILKYAADVATNINLNQDFRFAGECDT